MTTSKRTAPFLSLVFSFLNEEDTLPELFARLKPMLAQQKEQGFISGHELVFVNDASTDNSLAVLMKYARDDKSVKIVTTSRTFGVYQCMLTGFSFAKGDAVVYMDADLQDPPELIPTLVRAFLDDPDVDVVHTMRRSRQGETAFKLLITRIGHFILNRFTDIPIPQGAGDFKLLSRRAVDQVLAMNEYRPFLRGMVSWVGFKQIFVPYDRAPRQGGASKMFVISPRVLNIFLNHALVNFSDVPLKIPAYLGSACLIVFAGFCVAYLGSLFSHAHWSATASILTVVFLLFGLQFFTLWILGLYLAAVHHKSKNRPLAVIASVHNVAEADERQFQVRFPSNFPG